MLFTLSHCKWSDCPRGDNDEMTDNSELAGLQALVADVGSGNVIDAELLEGCTVQAHELDEMDEDQAACGCLNQNVLQCEVFCID